MINNKRLKNLRILTLFKLKILKPFWFKHNEIEQKKLQDGQKHEYIMNNQKNCE
jgi:hypothetical protein